MTASSLHDLARRAGIHLLWTGNDGVERGVGDDSLRALLEALGFRTSNDRTIADGLAEIEARQASPALPPMVTMQLNEPRSLRCGLRHGAPARVEYEGSGGFDFPTHGDAEGWLSLPAIDRTGYHRLLVDEQSVTLAVAPARCFGFDDIAPGERMFGLSVQTYGLRGKHTGAHGMGSGDFGALAAFARVAGHAGADAIGISPAHALFAGDLDHYSPYSPSNRNFLNVLLADPADTFDAARIGQALADASLSGVAQNLAGRTLVDWRETGAARLALMQSLFDVFERQDMCDPHSVLARSFSDFRRQGGDALHHHAVFEARHAWQFGRDFTKWLWRDWPGDFAESRSLAVTAFAREHARDVRFHLFAQWLATRSLAHAQKAAADAGMRIGLIGDLAVGLNSGGSHAWMRPNDLLPGVAIGAPPDALAPRGQNWGLTTFSPRALADQGYAPFIDTLRAAMRHTGGVRIDHVLGLARLWLVPDGMEAGGGAYVRYPLEDMLRLIALESARHRAIVIGEDLGTVPHGLREQLLTKGIAGLRVLLFERNWEGWHRPEWYPREAVAMTTTHDTATMAGWWRGRDIEVRADCEQLPPGQSRDDAFRERDRERPALLRALHEAACLQDDPQGECEPEQKAVDSAIAFLAKSSAQMVIVPLEDILGEGEQPNLPGTTTEHPNWRRRYRLAPELDTNARLAALRSRTARALGEPEN